jgi:tetratricopeptide (TPR) repeat protein
VTPTTNSHAQRPRGSGHDRRQFLTGLGALGVVVALPLVGGDSMPGISLETAAQRLRELSAAYPTAEPLGFAAAARGHLHVVVAALREGNLSLDDRPGMFRVAVDTACMVGQGEWLAGRRATAAAYFGEATDLAYESLQPELVARALAKASRVHSRIYGGDQPEEALRMLDRAVDLVEPGLVRYWIGVSRAEELAALGRVRECLDEYDRAVLHVGGGDSGGFFSRTGYLAGRDTTAELAGIAGRCYWQLGESEGAIDELRRAVAASNVNVRARPKWLIDLAHAYKVDGDLDAACDAASAALTECRETRYELDIDRIRALRASFPATWKGSQPLADLDEQLPA